MNLQGALDEKYIRIYVAHETTACNTWPLFRPNIFSNNSVNVGALFSIVTIVKTYICMILSLEIEETSSMNWIKSILEVYPNVVLPFNLLKL